MSHRYLADPGAFVYEDRVYIYNSNDDDNAEGGGYTMHSAVCVSSSDLKNWTDHGVVFQVPAGASWAQNSWAPQPIARDGKVFLYFGNGAAGVGVASSTSPTDGFKDARGSALINSSTPGASGASSWLFDPGVLIDDDGQAYLSFGGNGEDNPRVIKLGSNMVSVSGSATPFSAKGFFEASFLFKRNGLYYLAYSTNPANGQRIDYMTSTSPMSGYAYRGVLAGQPPVNSNNNQASEFEFKGNWYHAYHNRYVSTQAGIPTTYKRNLALDVLKFNADGTVQQVVYTTDGVPQVGTLNPYQRVEAETFNAQSGIETEPCSAGGMDVTQIGSGDWVQLRGVDFGPAGARTFTARVASAAGGGGIEARLGTSTGTVVATCTVPATGGAQIWMTVSCDATGAVGLQNLALKFTGGNFNFDYWQFTAGTGGTGGATSNGGTGGRVASGGDGGRSPNGGSAGAVALGGSPSGGASAGGSPGGASTSGGALAGGSSAQGGSLVAGGGNGGAAVGSGGVAGSGAAGTANGGAPISSGGAPGAGFTGTSAPGGGASAGGSADSGCSCRVSRHGDGPAFPTLGLGILLSLRRRRRTGA